MQTPEYSLPPQNIEAEQSILSACLLSPASMLEAADLILPTQFYRDSHQIIFNAMLRLAIDRKPVDLVMVADALKNSNKLSEIGGASYLQSVIDVAPMAVNIAHYCEIVKGCAVRRELIEQCNSITKDCYSSPSGAVEVLDDAQRRITAINFDAKDNVQKFNTIVQAAGERYEESYNNKNRITGVPTGYRHLDILTCGLQPSNLIIVAGRPSMGKSALAWCIADHAASKGCPVLIFSLEMSAEEYADRGFSKESQVNSQKFRSGNFEPKDWAAITDAGAELVTRPVWIDDTASVDINYVRRVARVYRQREKVGMVIIDHLQLMRGEKSQTRDREIASITGGLKAMAKELKVPVVLLSQLNRSLENRTRNDRRPRLSDLRDSGNIEQDADLVMFLYRDAVYNDADDNPLKNIAELDLKKQRSGPTGLIKLFWNERITTFFDLEV